MKKFVWGVVAGIFALYTYSLFTYAQEANGTIYSIGERVWVAVPYIMMIAATIAGIDVHLYREANLDKIIDQAETEAKRIRARAQEEIERQYMVKMQQVEAMRQSYLQQIDDLSVKNKLLSSALEKAGKAGREKLRQQGMGRGAWKAEKKMSRILSD